MAGKGRKARRKKSSTNGQLVEITICGACGIATLFLKTVIINILLTFCKQVVQKVV